MAHGKTIEGKCKAKTTNVLLDGMVKNAEICEMMKISKSTLYTYLGQR